MILENSQGYFSMLFYSHNNVQDHLKLFKYIFHLVHENIRVVCLGANIFMLKISIKCRFCEMNGALLLDTSLFGRVIFLKT